MNFSKRLVRLYAHKFCWPFSALLVAASVLSFVCVKQVVAAPLTHITIDGDFSDWSSVTSYADPNGAPGVLHNGVPDVHDTDHDTFGGTPGYNNHPDVDILEYKFTHDENNLYAYFKADGIIGNTQEASAGKAGRYYVIVTIDVDNDDNTGYFLHEGGYYPTSGADRYDMNMEAEFYDGQLNTAHYLSHDALDVNGLQSDFLDITNGVYLPTIDPVKNQIKDSEISANAGPYSPGFAEPQDGNYDNYTQWVYQENNPTSEADDQLMLVVDKGPVVPGIMTVSLSPDGHEIEIAAPFKGFLKDSLGNSNMALGKILDISFSLEASGELAPGGDWASDTSDPITQYLLESYASDFDLDGDVDNHDLNDAVDSWTVRYGVDLHGEDFLNWQRQHGTGVPLLPSSNVVPEPSSILVLGIAGALFLFRRQHP